MTKGAIQELVEASLTKLGQTIGNSGEIQGEGIFEGDMVKGYMAVDTTTQHQEIIVVGESSKFGGGIKISKKVLFPKDEAELKEFLEIIFSSQDDSN